MPKSEQGVSDNKRYAVIPRTLIFVVDGERVLLIKGSPQKRLWANLYNGIGGHVEQGEDILSAARRELFEETGLSCTQMQFCGTVMVDASDDLGVCIFVYRAEYEGGTLIPSNEGNLYWAPKNELAELPLVEDLKTILPRVLETDKETEPFSAFYAYDDQDQLVIRFGA